MKAKVTKRGLIVPGKMLAGAEEVEIRKEDHRQSTGLKQRNSK